MKTPRIVLSAIALWLGGCGASRAPTGSPTTLALAEGTYSVRSDLAGGRFGELLHFRGRGGVLAADRELAGGERTAGGVAIAEGDRLYVALGPRAASVDLVVLRRVDSVVTGTWAYGARGGAGTEAWSGGGSGPEPFVGTFETSGTDAESGEPYTGTITITREGELYRLRWVTGDVVCEGAGFVDDDVLVVVGRGEADERGSALFAAGDLGVAAYRREGTRYVGTFVLVRAAGGYDRGSEELSPER